MQIGLTEFIKSNRGRTIAYTRAENAVLKPQILSILYFVPGGPSKGLVESS